MKNLSGLLLLALLTVHCGSETAYSPKPRGYPRVIYPEKAYQNFQMESCDFSFEYPVYAEIAKDSFFFNEPLTHPCWFDIVVPQFNSRIHCSYYPIDAGNSYAKLRDDAFKLAYKHVIKANAIEEVPLQNSQGVTGFQFNLAGPVATFLTFYLTDEKEHFLRGALYFETQARPDSLAPIYEFMRKDVEHMISTFEWTN